MLSALYSTVAMSMGRDMSRLSLLCEAPAKPWCEKGTWAGSWS
jgi:hypothetical protein